MASSGPPTDGAARTRQRILDELRLTGRPLHPLDLATRLDLHATTVHRHLEVLEGAGLVMRRTEEDRERPGRPRMLFEVTTDTSNDCVGHRFLSRALAAFVAATLDPDEAGQQAGEVWGQHLVGARPFARTSAGTAIELALELLHDLGFAPSGHVEGEALQLGRCPYPELAEEEPELICALHAGLVRGALRGLGAPIEVTDFDSRPGGPCTLRYRRTDTAPAAETTT